MGASKTFVSQALRGVVVMAVTVSVAACGGATPEPSRPRRAHTSPREPVETNYEAPRVEGTIERGILIAVLDAGFGRFLQGVETEPVIAGGEFQGFRLLRLYPDDARFAALDLSPGDVIKRINGEVIERPEQALRVWESLRVASQLLVDYERDGEARQLRFSIED